MYHPKFLNKCINFNKNANDAKPDMYYLYKYWKKRLHYIYKNPRFAKLIYSTPEIEYTNKKELNNIPHSKFINRIKNLKRSLLNINKTEEYKTLKNYEKDIVESYIYNRKFNLIVDRIDMEKAYKSIIQILIENDLMIINKNDIIHKIKEDIKIQ
jgi:hypothetical protein